MIRLTVFIPALLAFAIATPFAALADSVETFEIAGMSLGMSVEEIEKAAAKHGLIVDHRNPGPSFAQRVENARGFRVDGKDFASVRGLKLVSETEEVNVNFTPTPEGARAYRISQLLLDRNLKPKAVGARIEQQYGEPGVKREKEWVWGDTTYYALNRKAPYLEFSIRPMIRSKSMKQAIVQLTLENPTLPEQVKAAVDAES